MLFFSSSKCTVVCYILVIVAAVIVTVVTVMGKLVVVVVVVVVMRRVGHRKLVYEPSNTLANVITTNVNGYLASRISLSLSLVEVRQRSFEVRSGWCWCCREGKVMRGGVCGDAGVGR